MEKKLIPYSVYLPAESHAKLKLLAKERKASEIIRDAITMMLNGGDLYKSGYHKGLDDAAKVIYDSKEAQMIAVNGKDLGVVLAGQIDLLRS